MLRRVFAACLLTLSAPLPASPQTLPTDPIVLGGGHVTLGGDVSWSFAPEDLGFFNYTDYEHSTLRMLRLALTASVKAGRHVTLLGEIRSENAEHPEPYGLYLRIRPWADRQFDVQVGRVPPTFGVFARRSYAADNPLIGYPMAYQYLTSLRADALPATTEELVRMRGRGWLTNFTIGNRAPDRGVPLVSAFRWDTGVQVHAGTDLVDLIAAVTTGTLSNPRFTDDNGGRQLAGRVELHPTTGVILGGSAARGPFVDRTALHSAVNDASPPLSARPENDFTQTAWGADAEYSRDYYLVRVETVTSTWTIPLATGPQGELPLRATATAVEGRYKLRPGLYVAARLDHLGFSEIASGDTVQTWDAPVTRVEIGGGYSIQRNLLLKLEFQHNTRDGGRVQNVNLGAAQVVFWF